VVPAQGFGCLGLSDFYENKNTVSEEEKMNLIAKVISLGVNHLDTSDIYGPHTNEILIGKTIKHFNIPRNSFTIATKFGIGNSSDGQRRAFGNRTYVRECCEASLKRLGLDYVDLYYVHRIDQTVPIEETMEELALLKKEGKIKHIGLSEAHPDTIRRAHAVHPLTAVQLEWSLWSRDVEEDLIPVLRELGIGIVCYSPLGRGFLSASIKKTDDLQQGDWRKNNPRFAQDAMDKNVVLLENLEKFAQLKGVTPAKVALSWVQHQGEDVITIPGTTKEKNLLDNIGSFSVSLTPEEVKFLSDAFPIGAAAGERYAEGSTYRNDKNPKKKT